MWPEVVASYQDPNKYKPVQKLASEHRDVCTADELTEMVQRQLEDHKVRQSDATELWQLEKQIQPALQLVRTRKTQLMLGAVKALQEKKNQLSKEKQVLEREWFLVCVGNLCISLVIWPQLLAARLNESNVDG
ncbi:AGAMOUS-like 31 [Artemisia annua]|uniref:AGAMOUS-like 31 n=1 Tax=Artemisia annua TaxID=35608 RepID=A0A2U1N5G9_ARTAN|nr:AGAMOUS-like 31 [Artemisia annua]